MVKSNRDNINKIMSKVKSKNTKPEMIVRKYLYSKGYRYRVNVKKIKGCPDIVFRKFNTVIFINGCFWHGHEGCDEFRPPKTNKSYWEPKLSKNKERDKEVKDSLINQGWNVITIWECMLKKENKDKTLNDLSILLSKLILDKYKVNNI
ncbi:very short patch repair endonuclease [Dysgonomonas capnocytophagoides]|uniref:Very short patch repair endonuclease n=1 Tax=Dysgonomonas capnocytophagoides TaxID=45254 RepID=A0A4Y8L3J8_9BACT|nr:very short patch repair endonuclease [Dysgonomonas capnocytophagoides]TFD96857.1 very short patch repair endonuclease [Dysgonomonas capnocytophagoides]